MTVEIRYVQQESYGHRMENVKRRATKIVAVKYEKQWKANKLLVASRSF